MVFNRFEIVLGWRYLLSIRRSVFSIPTFISISGVAVGVAALIVVISVMNGFHRDLRERLLQKRAHILIDKPQERPFEWDRLLISSLKKYKGVQSVTPFLQGQALLRKEGTSGALIKGIPEELLADYLKRQGAVAPLQSGIYLGEELGYQLSAFEEDELHMISPLETSGPLGAIPKTKKVKVAGFVSSGMYEYDASQAYLPLRDAQKFFKLPSQISGLEIVTTDPDRAPRMCQEIKKNLPAPFRCRDWFEMNQVLFAALKLEKLGMFVILSLITAVAVLNIVTSLTRLVLEKRQEISILKTMGASDGHIQRIFMTTGLFIGALGIFLGLVFGLGICWFLKTYPVVQLPDIFYNTTLPVAVHTGTIVVILAIAFALTLASALYPAYRAAQVDPVDSLRYE